MHVTLIAAGSRGDVQPLVALGRGLQSAGFTARIVALETFRSLVQKEGLEFAPMGGDPLRFIEETGIRSMRSGRNIVNFLRRHRRVVEAVYGRLLGNIWEALEDTDAVAFGTLTIMAYPLADARGIPRLAVPLQPITRSRAYPSLTVPQTWSRFGGAFNLATHHVDELLHWVAVRGAVAAGIRKVIGSDPFPRSGPYGTIYADERFPFFYGISPSVFRRPDDWPPWHVLTGLWFLDATEKLLPPVEAFLADGPPPVYIGFGSLPTKDPAATARALIGGVRRVGKRVILLRGWGGLGLDDVASDVLVVDEVPHARLFPRVAAIVHHGGAGTTAAALRAGRPQVVIPHFADQPFWAEKMRRLGVAPPPIRPRHLDDERLADALDRALSPQYRHRAAEIGERIGAEDGAGQAAAAIGRFLGHPAGGA
ncbi:L-noviosyl transferase [bacterium BMS3Abin02]|nr:L-noviosyl transferase [bacterium BMS3Abin02]GBE22670.1 L-noviosyl transferase [bacterium BMS3Bbin01]